MCRGRSWLLAYRTFNLKVAGSTPVPRQKIPKPKPVPLKQLEIKETKLVTERGRTCTQIHSRGEYSFQDPLCVYWSITSKSTSDHCLKAPLSHFLSTSWPHQSIALLLPSSHFNCTYRGFRHMVHFCQNLSRFSNLVGPTTPSGTTLQCQNNKFLDCVCWLAVGFAGSRNTSENLQT